MKSLKNDLLELINLTKETFSHQSNSENQKPATTDKIQDELDLFYKDLDHSEEGNSNESRETVAKINDKELSNLVGTKCSAPFSCSMYGNKTFHNAFICNVDQQETESLNKLMVRVLYINPIQQNMIPCSYFLDNTCKFEAAKCRNSHGELVAFDDVKEYKEPNFKLLNSKCPVLAKEKSLWMRGVVQSVNFDQKTCKIKLDQTKKEVEKEFEELFPIEERTENSDLDSSSSSDDSSDSEELQTKVETVNFQNLFHPDSHDRLGEFERHTKGIGSKLMAKMGYIMGSGLGKKGQGIIIPVSAQILPQGSSLDYCMNLREAANGDKDFFAVEKKLKRLKKKQERINEINYEKSKKAEQSDVFNFINNFSNKSSESHPKPSTSGVVKTNLKDHCNKKLNIANFQLSENIRKAEKEIEKLRESLKRHKPESEIYKNINRKVGEKSVELSALKMSEKRVAQEQSSRKSKDKLTIF